MAGLAALQEDVRNLLLTFSQKKSADGRDRFDFDAFRDVWIGLNFSSIHLAYEHPRNQERTKLEGQSDFEYLLYDVVLGFLHREHEPNVMVGLLYTLYSLYCTAPAVGGRKGSGHLAPQAPVHAGGLGDSPLHCEPGRIVVSVAEWELLTLVEQHVSILEIRDAFWVMHFLKTHSAFALCQFKAGHPALPPPNLNLEPITQAEQVEMDSYNPHLAQFGLERISEIEKIHAEYLASKEALTPFVDQVNALTVQQTVNGTGPIGAGFLMLDHNIISTSLPGDLRQVVHEYQTTYAAANSRNGVGSGAAPRSHQPVNYDLISMPDEGGLGGGQEAGGTRVQPLLGLSASDLEPTPTTIGEAQEDAQTPIVM